MSLIDKGWRKWTPKSVSGKKKPSQQDGNGEGGLSPLANFKPVLTARKGIIPIRGNTAVKGIPNPTKLHKTVSLMTHDQRITTSHNYRKYLSWAKDAESDSKRAEKLEEAKLREYEISNRQAPKQFDLTMKVLKKRRLSNMLATMVGKIAEDRAGEPIIGNDEWSVPEILNRVMTRVNINTCKQTRERERIVIILDTSPSCARYAKFFIDIAKASANLNDLEMYDAPNAYIVKQYSKASKEFVDIGIEYASILMEWEALKGRTIIFFGDWDGARILCKASKDTTIYWFNPEYYENSGYDKEYTGNHYRCRNEDDLIKLIKKMR